ncbi:MAG: hypothetical protein FWG36_01685 [Oscillospiraceae bacterium]|nr:hypothetical protein [Oscillospiraceae bacterium]
MKKRIVSTILALLMLAGFFPAITLPAAAADLGTAVAAIEGMAKTIDLTSSSGTAANARTEALALAAAAVSDGSVEISIGSNYFAWKSGTSYILTCVFICANGGETAETGEITFDVTADAPSGSVSISVSPPTITSGIPHQLTANVTIGGVRVHDPAPHLTFSVNGGPANSGIVNFTNTGNGVLISDATRYRANYNNGSYSAQTSNNDFMRVVPALDRVEVHYNKVPITLADNSHMGGMVEAVAYSTTSVIHTSDTNLSYSWSGGRSDASEIWRLLLGSDRGPDEDPKPFTLTITQKTDNAEIVKSYTFHVGGEPKQYTVTIDPNISGGTIVPNRTTAYAGEGIWVAAYPNEGYRIRYLTLDGAQAGLNDIGGSGRNFIMPARNAVLGAFFEKIPLYDIQFANITNGTITADPPKAAVGETVTLTVTPNDGYELKAGSLKCAIYRNVNTVPINAETLTFVMPSLNTYNTHVIISAVFDPVPRRGPSINAPTSKGWSAGKDVSFSVDLGGQDLAAKGITSVTDAEGTALTLDTDYTVSKTALVVKNSYITAEIGDADSLVLTVTFDDDAGTMATATITPAPPSITGITAFRWSSGSEPKFTVDLGGGKTAATGIASIASNATDNLTADTDFTFSGTTITIKNSYLEDVFEQSVNSVSLTVTFNDTANTKATVTVTKASSGGGANGTIGLYGSGSNHINLAAETVSIDFTVAAYSLDGGKKWKKGPLPTDKKLAGLFNKGFELAVADKWNDKDVKEGKTVIAKKGVAEDAAIVSFPKIEKRPKGNEEKLAAFYWSVDTDTWVLSKKGSTEYTAPTGRYEWAASSNGKTPSGEWSSIPAKGWAIEQPGKKVTYLFRTVAVASGDTFIPSSKIFKIKPAAFLKAPTYKAPAVKNGAAVLKLKKGDLCTVNDKQYGSLTAATILNVVHTVTDSTDQIPGGSKVTIWKAGTGKKPCSLEQKELQMPTIPEPTS